MEKLWKIYRITNPVGGIYIGRTSNFKSRMYTYSNNNDKNVKAQPELNKSLLEYGFTNHTVDILEQIFCDRDEADCKEMFWIRSYMSNKSKWPEQNGLNLTDGSTGGIGVVHTGASKKKWSELKLGKTKSTETRRRMLEAQTKLNGKPILQYDSSGNFIKEHISISSAARYIGSTQPLISNCLIGNQKSTRGFVFKYK